MDADDELSWQFVVVFVAPFVVVQKIALVSPVDIRLRRESILPKEHRAIPFAVRSSTPVWIMGAVFGSQEERDEILAMMASDWEQALGPLPLDPL